MQDKLEHAKVVANVYAQLKEVKAIALAGSLGAGNQAAGSDIDLYVYGVLKPSDQNRVNIASSMASSYDLLNNIWESGDEWVDRETDIHVDVMFRTCDWIETELDKVLFLHKASAGYTTCFWSNVKHSVILFDPDGWFERLQKRATQPYPQTLKSNIINVNFGLLSRFLFSYRTQTAKALKRQDLVSVNHRMSAFLASYFDVIFALNELPHPGEKRLISTLQQHCTLVPENAESNLKTLLTLSADNTQILEVMDTLITDLRNLLLSENMFPNYDIAVHREHLIPA